MNPQTSAAPKATSQAQERESSGSTRREYSVDAYSPREVSEKIELVGVAKAQLPTLQTLVLGMVAGGFIGLGALFSMLVISDTGLSFAVSRLAAGVVFSLGLILVVVAGAELFTGNNLLVMAWADRRITTAQMLRNWVLVYAANAAGAIGLAVTVFLSHHAEMNGGGVGVAYVKVAAAKTALPFWEAFFKGVLCNLLVCLAVWLTMAGRTVTDKLLAVVFPISAFVAAGFEHSVANMYVIPLGILLKDAVTTVNPDMSTLSWIGFIHNLAPVTLGNIVGGSVMVALVYHVIYGKSTHAGRP